MNRKITLILPLIVLGFIFNAKAQCPPNIDWELGSYSNWTYYTGSCCPISVPTPGWVAGRHTLTTGPGVDPYGGFPVVAPGGGSYSFKLGNEINGSQAERARYNVPIPTGGIYSLIYRYAVVLNDPAHTATEQPRMTVNATDSNTGLAVPCAQYTYVANGSIPGFLTSPTTGYGSPVYYKTWTMGNMKFPGLGGHTAIIDFTTGDCGYGGHFGYGYIDMTCGLFANQIIGCASGTTVLAGPDGYASYVWKDSATFSITYGTSAVVVITAPTVTTTYAVLLTPYTGYGCPDTLYTRVIPSTLYVNAGNDTAVCNGTGVTLTSGATSAAMPLSYTWSPSTGLSCITCANPVATPSVTTSYTVTVVDAAGCIGRDNMNLTIYPMPTSIVGPGTVCPSETITLSATGASGAVWSCTPTSIATINPSTGTLTGIIAGTVTVTAQTGPMGICNISRVITVNPAPAAITGASRVCAGQCTTFSSATSGGTWSDPAYTAIATVGSTTGIVCGVTGASGLALISYTVSSTGCRVTKPITVDPLPAPITGLPSVCVGATITLSGSPSGGSWSFATGGSGSVTVNSTSGDVTGVTSGTVSVVYTLSSGCSVSRIVTVNPLPSAISGPDHVCVGRTITLTDTDPTGVWSATNSNAGVTGTAGTATVTGFVGGIDTILYTTAGGCSASYVVTIDPTPSPIIVAPTVCVGGFTIASDVDPGTWSISPTTRADINSTSGVVSGIAAGAATITLTSPYGCTRTAPITVIAAPLPITGTMMLCVGTTTLLSDATPGGSFSMACPTIATVTPTGIVGGVGVGSCTVTYTHTASGCYTTAVVTVNTSPGTIVGNVPICVGQSISVFNAVSGGSWSVAATTVASVTPVGPASASVTGVGAGTTTLTYSLGAGCSTTATITVNPIPGAIVGTPSLVICQGSNTTLSSSPPGGTWSTTATSIITLNSTSGAVTGNNAGTAIVTYTSTAGCTRTGVVTVNPIPAVIAGPSQVCTGSCITLTSSTAGGTWSTLTAASIGTINSATGVFCGLSTSPTPSVATIKYTLTATTCARTTVVTVNPLPTAYAVSASGSTNICAGSAGTPICLAGSQSGVSYQLFNGAMPVGAPIPGNGASICFPPQTTSGTYTVAATNPTTTCTRNMTGSVTLVVYPVPVLVGPSAVCNAATGTLIATPSGGTWSSSNPGCVGVGATSGVITGVGGTGCSAVITYTALPSGGGCVATRTVTVSPSPTLIYIPRGVCAADTVTVSSTPAGGTWTTGSACITIGASSGLVTGVSGPCAAPITYSLGSGCTITNTINVTPQPGVITGPGAVCEGATIVVGDTSLGGVWTTPSSSISITPAGTSCTILGVSAGVATIYYVASGGTGCSRSRTITVNPMPTSFSGPAQVCQGSSITLGSTPGGGTWSITSGGLSGAIVTATPTTATFTGTGTGPAAVPVTVAYTAAGCTRTGIVTVNPLPTSILGTNRVCQGSSITLNATPAAASATWSSSLSTLATVTSPTPGTGIVTGGSGTGTVNITYTLATGCYKSMPVTVNQAPGAIIGPAGVCVGQPASFINPMAGGTWSSSIPAVAPIGSLTGIIPATSLPGGVVTITYTWNSCPTSTSFTVIPNPLPIVGPARLCNGACQIYTDPTPLGTWTSSFPSVATVDPSTGNVCGVSTGTTLISYGVGSCVVTKPVIINPVPNITGPNVVCEGQTIMLHDTALGGAWSSLTPAIGTVVATTGVVTGVSGGTATIRYTLTSGCFTDYNVTVNPAPAAITGGSVACVGQMVAQFTTSTGGTWSSSNPTVGTIDPALGVVAALSPGTTTIRYTFTSTGCATSKLFTVQPVVAPINGPGSVCMGSTVPFTNPTSGGSWMSSNPLVGTIDATTGMFTPISLGTTTLTYSIGTTSCFVTKTINVIGSVPAISGPPDVCVGDVIYLSNPSSGGTWTSSYPGTASVGASTGDVTGVAAGTATITYSLGIGCENTTVVTVNPLPGAIIGSPNVCVGSSVTFTSTPFGGSWSSSDITVATVTPSGGLVTGVNPGSCVIYYTLPTGCTVSMVVNVSFGPLAIAGPNSFCVGGAVNFFDGTPGGIWSSSNALIAPIDSLSGVMSGLAAGTTMVSYTVTGFACPATMPVTINPTPGAITGVGEICQGSNTTLANPVPGGTWISYIPAVATIHPASGVVTGVVTGATGQATVTVEYSLGAGPGCTVNKVMTIDPLPAAIFGLDSVCSGQTILMFNSTLGGTWSSTVPTVGTIDATGVFGGVSGGTTTVSYTNSYGCATTHPVLVNTSPTTITGSDKVCLGSTTILYNTVPGGVWTSSATGIAPVGASSGVVTGLALGSASITYTTRGNCASPAHNITVNPLPLVYTVTGGGNHCSGDLGVHIYLSGSTVGVNYMLYLGAAAVGAFPGTGSVIDFGLHTLAGTYTVKAISTSTTCQVNMAGSAAIGIIPSVTPSVTLNITPNDTICAGTTASFAPVPVNGGTAPVYSWRVNGLLVSVSNTYSFIPADGDVVEVSMVSNAICPSPATVTRTAAMSVKPYGPPAVSLALTPNDTVCKGTMVTASPVTSHAGTAPAYTWYKNGVIVSYTASSYTWPADNADEIFVVMFSNDPCRIGDYDSSARVVETVADPVLPVITISASKGTTIHKGESNTLTAVVAKAVNPTYQWYINGMPVAGATNVSFTSASYSYPQQDSISVAVTSHGVCEVTAHEWVYIQVVTTGVNQVGAGSDIVVVPNPTTGRFTVKGSLSSSVDEDVALEVTNVLGQVVYKENVVAKSGKLNHEVTLSKGIANGMYMLTLRSGSDNKVFHVVVEQ